MKKILVLGLLAIAASAFTQQQASAWVNSKLGVGISWDYQAGGNSALWGLWRNNQPGGADPVPHFHHRHGGYGHGAPCPTPGFVPGPGPKMIVPAPAPGSPAMIPMAIPMEQPAHSYQGYVSPYQFATYPRPVYYYYYYPAYAQ